MASAHEHKCRLVHCLHEFADNRKPEAIARGNERVLYWRKSVSGVEGAYPVHFFEISSNPSAVARLKHCLEKIRGYREPNLLRHPIRRHSRRL